MNILHVITGLHVGGAETMLLRLLSSTDRRRFRSAVLSLLPMGPLAGLVAEMAVPVASLDMPPSLPGPKHVVRLAHLARRLAPDLIQGWMYHGNLAGTFAWLWSGRRRRLVWSVHHSITGLAEEKELTQRLIGFSARVSRLPQAIVYCSAASARQHEALGFAAERTVIIPNGIDTVQFHPDPEAVERLRELTGAPVGCPMVGMVARYHPMKDHANLIRAAGRLRQVGIELHLVLIGRGVDASNPELATELSAARMSERTSLLGMRLDVPALVPGLDLLVQPSAYGEAFPLVVGEAMAAGIPCIVTDVGDCAWLVGNSGEVVPPRDSQSLAAAIGEFLARPVAARRLQGERARARVIDSFALPTIVRRYEELYAGLVARVED